ncbi:Similar to hypothetical protein [Tuber melanosporum Mel28]; acc. no. XP_002836842 [Pyronema omphalodes CBS 100304]|uniref:Uncharacterized protein n=1 Tax=Pyronema omphalodes (strain CBS 100304) TaxID=1076935 RepID=U4LSW6_PYROM|nr:Similar to hypothetical protein [Tuber melanosporum Mel28]; acc. no. XP_002836842 [Pyronema omphalodes CBS 100304]
MHPEVAVDFNEILSMGYLEEQQMNYHQNGEKGAWLLPLSHPSPSVVPGSAEMCFRVKRTGNVKISKISKPCLKLMLHYGDVWNLWI